MPKSVYSPIEKRAGDLCYILIETKNYFYVSQEYNYKFFELKEKPFDDATVTALVDKPSPGVGPIRVWDSKRVGPGYELTFICILEYRLKNDNDFPPREFLQEMQLEIDRWYWQLFHSVFSYRARNNSDEFSYEIIKNKYSSCSSLGYELYPHEIEQIQAAPNKAEAKQILRNTIKENVDIHHIFYRKNNIVAEGNQMKVDFVKYEEKGWQEKMLGDRRAENRSKKKWWIW